MGANMNIEVNNINLYYENIGNGRPIILLHGNGEDHKIFDILISQLSKDFSVYAIDSRCHGNSEKTQNISYEIMMEDIAAFITKLDLKNPILYGFSDGGIIGLLLASKYPNILSKLIVSGANTNPLALKRKWQYLINVTYFFTRSNTTKMMLKEPNIQKEDLNKIQIPVLVLAGNNDIVKEDNTRFISDNINSSTLKILDKETHSSYVINSDKLYNIIKDFII